MAPKRTPLRPDDEPPEGAVPPPGGEPDADAPLPTWYRPPGEGDPPAGSEPPPMRPEPADAKTEPGEPSLEPPAPASPTPFAWEPPPAPPAPPSWATPPAAPPGPVFERSPDAAPTEPELDDTAAPTTAEPALETGGAEPTLAGDAAPLTAAAAVPPGAEVPGWSRAQDLPEPPPIEPPSAVADAWTTHPEPGAPQPTWVTGRREHAHVFGDRMAAGVLLTLAAASMLGGGIYALVISGSDVSPTMRAVICGVAAAVLLAGAVLLRLVRGTEDLRGTLAVVGIGFAAACIVFAYNPDPPTDQSTLTKFALGAGVVAVLSWFAAVVVPSAVAGLLGVIALGAATGAGVWLGLESPTHVQVFVAAIGVGIAVALVLPRIALLRPHPAGLGWALAGAAVVITFPAIELMARQDAVALAAGASASAALLAIAQRYRNLPAALGALAGLAYLELLLVSTRTGNDNGSVQTTQLIIFVAVGAVLAVLVAGAVVVQKRRRSRVTTGPARRMPVGLADVLLLAALALSLLALFTGPRDIQLTPTQLQPGTTTTSAAPGPTSL